MVGHSLADYRNIYTDSAAGKPRRISVDNTNRLHKTAVAWITKEITDAKTQGLRVIVLTHHAPSCTATSHPDYATSPIASAFSTNLEHLMDDSVVSGVYNRPFVSTPRAVLIIVPVAAWCYGHTHYNNDQVIRNVKVMANQRGYIHEDVNQYDRECVVCIAAPQ